MASEKYPEEPHRPTEDQIRARAYEICLQRGCRPGHDIDDWLQAEYELWQLPIGKIAELPKPTVRKIGGKGKSLVALVKTALLSGSAALPHVRR